MDKFFEFIVHIGVWVFLLIAVLGVWAWSLAFQASADQQAQFHCVSDEQYRLEQDQN